MPSAIIYNATTERTCIIQIPTTDGKLSPLLTILITIVGLLVGVGAAFTIITIVW